MLYTRIVCKYVSMLNCQQKTNRKKKIRQVNLRLRNFPLHHFINKIIDAIE